MNKIEDFLNKVTPIPAGHCVAITQNNRSTFYGMFETFNDSDELKKENKWRFIPIDRISFFYQELHHTKLPNPEHTVIIEGDSISKLELIKCMS